QPDQGALESTDCLCSACRLGLYHRLLGPSRDYYSVRAILMGRKTEDERRRSAIPSFVLRPSPIHQKSSDGVLRVGRQDLQESRPVGLAQFGEEAREVERLPAEYERAILPRPGVTGPVPRQLDAVEVWV